MDKFYTQAQKLQKKFIVQPYENIVYTSSEYLLVCSCQKLLHF